MIRRPSIVASGAVTAVIAMLAAMPAMAQTIDGDIDPEIAAGVPLLTASPVDGPGPGTGTPPSSDYGNDGSLVEMYGTVTDQYLYVAVRGDFFGDGNGDNNATVVLIDVDPGSGTGVYDSIDLDDTTGIHGRVTVIGGSWLLVPNSAYTNQADGFDAAIIVNGAFDNWEVVTWDPALGQGTGSTTSFETILGTTYGFDTEVTSSSGAVAADGSSALASGVGGDGFEVMIPRSLLGLTGTGGYVEAVVYTVNNGEDGFSPNMLPENEDEGFDSLLDFDGLTQQVGSGVPSSASIGPAPPLATVFDVVIDAHTQTVLVNSLQVSGTATPGAHIQVTTDLSGNSVMTSAMGSGDFTAALTTPLVDGDTVTATDLGNSRSDTAQAVAEDLTLRLPPAAAAAIMGTAQGGATVDVEVDGAPVGTAVAGNPGDIGIKPWSLTWPGPDPLAFGQIVTATDTTNTATDSRTASAVAGVDGDFDDMTSLLGSTELTLQVVETGFGTNKNQLDTALCGEVGSSLLIGVGGSLEGENSFLVYINTDTTNDNPTNLVAAGTFDSPVLDDIVLPINPEYGLLVAPIYGQRTKLEQANAGTIFDVQFAEDFPSDEASTFEAQAWTDDPLGLFAVGYNDGNDSPSPPGAGESTRGFEILLPAAAIGAPDAVQIIAVIDNGEGTWLSNQSLPPMTVGTANPGAGTPDLTALGVTAALDLPCVPTVVAPAVFTGIEALQGGSVRITWTDGTDGEYIVQGSDHPGDLAAWSNLETNTAPASATKTYDDPEPLPVSRVYRIQQ